VLIIDEATQVSTRDADRLLGYAAATGTVVIAVGDPAQLGAVGAGGWFTRLAAGTAPDVADIETKWMPGFYVKNMLLDLTPHAKRMGIKPDDYYAQEWQKAQIGGKLLCFPLDLQIVVMFFNKDLFQAKGVKLPPAKWDDPTWTWDEVLLRARQLTGGEGGQKTFGIDFSRGWVYTYPLIWSNGGTVLNKEHTKATLTDAATVDSIQFRADLINKLKVSPRPSDEQGMAQLGDIFKTGRVAMNWAGGNGYWVYADITAFKWGVAPGPWRDTNKAVNFTDPVLVSGDSKIADTAWSFVKYLTSKEGQIDYVQATGTPPVRLDVLDTWLDYELPKTGMKSKDDLKKVALYYENSYIDNWAHYTINAGQFQTIQTQDGQPIWDGQVAAKDQMPKIQKDMDDALVKTYDEYKGTRLSSDTLCQPIVASGGPPLNCEEVAV
jgi:multiple sugar transport system substrate-binding protein